MNTDSIRLARQRVLDSTRQEQQRKMDSARQVRQHIADSMSAARKRVADSLGAIREYRESKHYKDSVASVRQERLDSIRAVRTAALDSMRAIRQHTADSLMAIRKHTADSIRAVQKRRSDSLAVIRKYKESKRYKDSVALVKQIRLDSTKQARKAIAEELVARRKKSLDSAAAIRKKFTDSLTAVRTKYMDSLKAVRKVRTDSLAKIKEQKERLKKSKEKQKEDKLKLALELKIKKKREAWNNEKMLKKKWSLPRRVLQNTYTHYNYFFNADRKMDEALDNMQRMSRENYDSLLALFPFDPDKDSSKLAADMDSIIRKASLGIQIHDPRTKWADDLYLLMGQAYYYKGNYAEAANSFRYIIAMNQQRRMEEQKKAAAKKKPVDKEVSIVQAEKGGVLDFMKHRSVNNEAILWLARTYTEGRKEDDAESILELIETDKNFNDELKGRIALEKAYLNLSRKEYSAASDNLDVVASDDAMPDWLRTRASYINGQLLFDRRDYAGASGQFRRVIDLKPKIDMDFYARKQLSYSLIEQGGSQEEATGDLRRMLKDGKYLPYYEQVYYVLGRLSANSNQPDQAIDYLKKSIESSKSTRKQKALSFAGLGNVYYSTGAYEAAKVAYDSATYYGKSIAGDEMILQAGKRAVALDNVVGPDQTIRVQDSLLALAALPEKEQRAIVRRYIRDLEKQKEDSAFRAATASETMKTMPEEDGDPGAVSGQAGWYFGNPVLMQQGFNDFKRKWGNRQNVDNWRRMGSGAGGNTGIAGSTDAGTDETTEVDERGIPTEAALLALIPGTKEEQQLAHKRIEGAYLDLAKAYVYDLEDYPQAIKALDSLEHRYPNHGDKAEALYLRYQVALKQNDLVKAQALSERIRREFGESSHAEELTPKQETEGLLASNVPVANYYDETYGMMMQRQYQDVLQRARDGQRQYKDPVFTHRFTIMEAIALAGIGEYNQADTVLTTFINTQPHDSLRNWADVVLSYVKKNKPVPPPKPAADTAAKDSTGAKAAGMQPAANAPAAEAANVQPPPAAYSYKPSAEHYFIFFFNKMESKSMGVKAGIGDFNTFNYSSQHLTAQLEMLQQDQGIITVRSFPSAAHARIYMNSLRSNNMVFKEYKGDEYTLMVISADNFRKLHADRDVLPYLKFYKANYK